MDADRREVLRQAALLLAGFSLSRCKKEEAPAPPDAMTATPVVEKLIDEPVHAFAPQQRATLEAATFRILPSDQDPGAKEADVISYIDREVALPEWESLKAALVAGTVALDKLSARFGGKRFVELSGDEQDDIIGQVQNASDRGRDFVKILTLMTIEGFACDPKYLGNKDGVGWKFIGYGPGIHEH